MGPAAYATFTQCPAKANGFITSIPGPSSQLKFPISALRIMPFLSHGDKSVNISEVTIWEYAAGFQYKRHLEKCACWIHPSVQLLSAMEILAFVAKTRQCILMDVITIRMVEGFYQWVNAY
jgi:hypothetical protein